MTIIIQKICTKFDHCTCCKMKTVPRLPDVAAACKGVWSSDSSHRKLGSMPSAATKDETLITQCVSKALGTL